MKYATVTSLFWILYVVEAFPVTPHVPVAESQLNNLLEVDAQQGHGNEGKRDPRFLFGLTGLGGGYGGWGGNGGWGGWGGNGWGGWGGSGWGGWGGSGWGGGHGHGWGGHGCHGHGHY